MKNAIIITARTSSSRLHGKILKKIGKKFKAIDILIMRAKKINLPIILATTKSKSDNKLYNYVKKKHKINIFRGDNMNKLNRWYKCFVKFKIKNAAIIDGDDILFNYEIYKEQIKNVSNYEIISAPKKMITGLFTHIITLKALKKMKHLFQKNIDSEMIEPFIKKTKVKRKLIKTKSIFQSKKVRLTLDYAEDLKVLSIIVDQFGPYVKNEKIVNFLLKNKNISRLNYFRESYWKKNQLKKINLLVI